MEKKNKTEDKKNSKSIVKLEEKQIKIFVWVMIFAVVFFLAIYLSAISEKKFKYSGLIFEKKGQGDLFLYYTEFPVIDFNGNVVSKIPFYFREDPRKLQDIAILGGKIMLRKNVALAINGDDIENCEDGVLSGTVISLFLSKSGVSSFGATTNQKEAEELNRRYVNCKNPGDYSVIVFQKADENKIIKSGDCYTIQYSNCEIMNVTEKFMIALYAHSRGIDI